MVLNLFNPRIRVVLGQRSIHLGDDLKAEWQFDGRSERVRRLTFTLQGEERATYRRGTDTRTDTHVFVRLIVLETEDASAISAGSVHVQIPKATMHSFRASNNEVSWKLKVQGEIPRFPDIAEEFQLDILPQRLPSAL